MRDKMISVIVPIYNTEKYIRRCVNSILNQSYQNFEIILIDDGSTDNSAEICKSFEKSDSRIKYIYTANGGQGRARNIGLDNAKGDYIGFVDSDDWILPNMIINSIKEIEKNKADISICGLMRNHGFYNSKMPIPSNKILFDNHEYIKALFQTYYIGTSVCNKIYCKDIWNTLRFPEVRAREDAYVTNILIGSIKKAVHIAEYGYIQYVRPGSTERSKFNQNKLITLEIEKEKAAFIRENYPELAYLVILWKEKAIMRIMGEIIEKFSYFEFKQIYRKLNDELDYLIKEKETEQKDNTEFLNLVKIHNHKFYFVYCHLKTGIKQTGIDFLQKMYEEIFE